jgi:hypothetical protein
VGVLDVTVRDVELVEAGGPLLELAAAGDREGDVVEADAVLAEGFDRGGRPVLVQADQGLGTGHPDGVVEVGVGVFVDRSRSGRAP